jgi:hypothetical protein
VTVAGVVALVPLSPLLILAGARCRRWALPDHPALLLYYSTGTLALAAPPVLRRSLLKPSLAWSGLAVRL